MYSFKFSSNYQLHEIVDFNGTCPHTFASNFLSNVDRHTRLMALFPGLPKWASTRKVKPIWILLKQETVSGSGISWAICKSSPRCRQITTPAPHHSVFYRPDALPATQPTASKHWRHKVSLYVTCHFNVSLYATNVDRPLIVFVEQT